MKKMFDRLRLSFAYEDKNTGLVVVEGALWAAVIQLTNPFYQLFVRQMGGNDIAIGLVNSLPALFALIILLPMSAYIETVPRKKAFVSKMIAMYSFLIPLMAISPFMGQAKVPVFILLIALFNIPLLGYTVGWQGFFTDIFDERQRVMPYAKREMMRNYIQGFCMCAGGFILSYLCTDSSQKIMVYQILFMMAFAFALLQRKTLLMTDDSHVKTVEQKKINIVATLKMCQSEMKKNKKYASFLGLLFFFYFSWQMAWPMFFIYVVDYAGANEFVKNMLDFSGVILFALTSTWWGKYIQKNGAKKASVFGYFSSAMSPIWLVLWHSYAGLFANYIFGGIFAGALHLGMFNDMLEELPKENRTFNLGIYNTITQLSAFIAPLVGVAIYRATDIMFVMCLATALRGAAATLFLIRYWKSKKTSSHI